MLAWVCPAGVSSPSESAQAAFCDVLFNEGVIASCQPPNGDVIEPPTTPAPTPEARYEAGGRGGERGGQRRGERGEGRAEGRGEGRGERGGQRVEGRRG